MPATVGMRDADVDDPVFDIAPPVISRADVIAVASKRQKLFGLQLRSASVLYQSIIIKNMSNKAHRLGVHQDIYRASITLEENQTALDVNQRTSSG